MNSKIDTYSKFIAFLSILLIIYGILYNYFYYRHYNIIITQYIDLSEAVLLFIPQLFKLSWLIAYITFVYLIVSRPLFIDRNMFFSKINSKRQRKTTWIIIIIYLLLLLYFFLGFEFGFIHYSLGFRTLLLVGMIFFSPFLISKLYSFFEKFYQFNLSVFTKDLTYAVVIITGLVLNSAVGNWERDKRKGSYIDFEIKFKNGSNLKSDSNYLFLGKTKSYFFIYNYSKQISKALKEEIVESFEFKTTP